MRVDLGDWSGAHSTHTPHWPNSYSKSHPCLDATAMPLLSRMAEPLHVTHMRTLAPGHGCVMAMITASLAQPMEQTHTLWDVVCISHVSEEAAAASGTLAWERGFQSPTTFNPINAILPLYRTSAAPSPMPNAETRLTSARSPQRPRHAPMNHCTCTVNHKIQTSNSVHHHWPSGISAKFRHELCIDLRTSSDGRLLLAYAAAASAGLMQGGTGMFLSTVLS